METEDFIPHRPIMKEEVVSNLVTDKAGIYLDCTLGFGGHSHEILNRLNNNGQVIGLDCDIDAFNYSKKRFKKFDGRIKIFNSNYSNYEEVLKYLNVSEIDGALLDLGISSYQIDSSDRGFSYRYEAPLDMRFDTSYKLTAFEVLNRYSEKELSFIIKNYGEEKNHNKIAKSIVKKAKRKTMNSTYDLRNAIKEVNYRPKINKTLSRVFQSIRIEVNNELEKIKEAIESLPKRIKIGGKLVLITFHSLEDRLVKRTLFGMDGESVRGEYVGKKKIKILNKKVIKPSREEVLSNRRSRSAKLRFITIV